MADWGTKTLGELCEFQRGLTYGKSDEVDASKNVVLRANNVDLATHKQQAFVDFVLAQYVKQGVDELDAEKLPPLLKLKYTALNDALKDLGNPEQIRQVFVGFQRYLYEPSAGELPS